ASFPRVESELSGQISDAGHALRRSIAGAGGGLDDALALFDILGHPGRPVDRNARQFERGLALARIGCGAPELLRRFVALRVARRDQANPTHERDVWVRAIRIGEDGGDLRELLRARRPYRSG